MNPRWIVATLAHPTAQWPTTIAQWATNGAAALDLRACLSPGELDAVVTMGISPDAVLLDGGYRRVDERAIAAVIRCGAVPVGVDSDGSAMDWERLGVGAVLRSDFTVAELIDTLSRVAAGGPGARPASTQRAPHRHGPGAPGSQGHGTSADSLIPGDPRHAAPIVAVCGPGGCGSSTISMSIAQGLALDTATPFGRVLLIDGARRSHQALYHHTGDVLPALGDLVDRVRRGSASSDDLASTTFGTSRGYRLLAGVPTPRDFARFDSPSLRDTLEFTSRNNDLVVVDHDGDLPGGPLAGALVELASVWVVVVRPGLKGTHDAARFTEEARSAGVPAEQVVVICNGVRPRDPARVTFPAELARILGDLGINAAPAVAVPRARNLEARHRDATRLPRAITRVPANRVRRMLQRDPRPPVDTKDRHTDDLVARAAP